MGESQYGAQRINWGSKKLRLGRFLYFLDEKTINLLEVGRTRQVSAH